MRKSVKFKTKIGILKHLPGMRYLEISSKIVKDLGGTFKLRLLCTVNGKVSFQCGLMALGQGKAYISITKSRMKQLKVQDGQTVEVSLKHDTSKFGMKMCPELKEILSQDDEARLRFAKLTPGRQRYIIHYVGIVKNVDLRIERAFLILENLKKMPVGKEKFRDMLRRPSISE